MKIETPFLRRVGPVSFWRGRDKCLPALEAMYRRAAEKAAAVLKEKGDGSGAKTPGVRRTPPGRCL